MLERSGYFAVIKRSFGRLSDDQRVQAVLIAFCFGALLEALAGFGTPVAICSVMLIGLGFQPVKAAAVALVANTAPVAFGAIAVPITTLAPLANLPKDDLGAMVGRQTPFLALVVPLILVAMVDGRRGIKAAWPAALVGGLAFAIGQFACSNYLSVELADVVASLARRRRDHRAAAVLAARRASSACRAGPRPAMAGGESGVDQRRFEKEARLRADAGPDGNLKRDTPARDHHRLLAVPDHHRRLRPRPDPLAAVLRLARRAHQGVRLARAATSSTRKGKAPTAVTLQVQLGQRGRHAAADLRPAEHDHAARRTRGARSRPTSPRSNQLKFAILTVATVLALAYVMNLSGQTITIGNVAGRRRRAPSRCSRRSSAGWASRSPARTRRPTRCSAPCRCRRPRRPTSRRCSWPPRTPAAACWAR